MLIVLMIIMMLLMIFKLLIMLKMKNCNGNKKLIHSFFLQNLDNFHFFAKNWLVMTFSLFQISFHYNALRFDPLIRFNDRKNVAFQKSFNFAYICLQLLLFALLDHKMSRFSSISVLMLSQFNYVGCYLRIY